MLSKGHKLITNSFWGPLFRWAQQPPDKPHSWLLSSLLPGRDLQHGSQDGVHVTLAKGTPAPCLPQHLAAVSGQGHLVP